MSKADEKAKTPGHIVVDNDGFAADPVEADTELGAVQIHNSVIAAISRLAALNVPGVHEMSGGIVDELAGVIGRKSLEKGIRVEVADAGVTIFLNLIMDYGVRIPHVAWQVQNEVRKAVEQMTGKTVKSVQVLVQGVRMAEGRPVESRGEKPQ